MGFLEHNWEHVLAFLGGVSILLHMIEAGCANAGWTKYEGIFSQLVKFIQGFLGAKPPTPPTRGDTMKMLSFITTLILACFLLLTVEAKADGLPASITNALVAKQSILYLNKDAKVKNVTTFQLLTTNHMDSWGKAGSLLWDGLSLDAGPSYDALKSIDGGAVVLSKDFNSLISQMPVSFPLKDILHPYLQIGDCVGKGPGKITQQLCEGGAYIRGEIKF